MKKDYMKWSGISLISAFVLSSCVADVEAPAENGLVNVLEDNTEVIAGGENLRKSIDYNYSEKFNNQLFQMDYAGENPFGVAFFPGTGEGVANRMGKSASFINQLALFDLESGNLITVDAPVTQFFSAELESLGLTGIPDEVSSLTTDGKGNAIWFRNIKNVTTPISETLTQFEAQVEVIGGNGRFAGVTGQGVVKGTYNPLDGKGSSILEARVD